MNLCEGREEEDSKKCEKDRSVLPRLSVSLPLTLSLPDLLVVDSLEVLRIRMQSCVQRGWSATTPGESLAVVPVSWVPSSPLSSY